MSWRDIFKQFLRQASGNLEPDAPQQPERLQQGYSPKLTREDVLRLIGENGGPEGLDLSGCDLSGINLMQLDLHGIAFGSLKTVKFSGAESIERGANLEGAFLERSNLQRANFGRANLKGARLYKADLTEATLWTANAEGADLSEANLSRASLRSTIFRDARLDEAILEGADLYLADLRGATFSAGSIGPRVLQESYEDFRQYLRRWYVLPEVRERFEHRYLEERHKIAAEVYLALKNVFLNAGRYDDASWAYFKERQMRRITLAPWRARRYYGDELPIDCRVWSWRWWWFYAKYTTKWALNWIAELSCGYGERPLRVTLLAVVVILLFPFLYQLSGGVANLEGHPIRWIDYLHYSLAAFSTIGFPDLAPRNDFAKILTSLEALLGISALALLMFALGNRISRS
jgi:uncharacterized protein YjbI with pentapeptide repeats